MTSSKINNHPLVSAIMLAGRMSISDITKAIQCFQSQSYPNKELIIVNNAFSQFEASKLNIAASDNVFIIDTPTHLHAGMARNFGIRAANGQILSQFDADYWHDSDRLSSQIAAMAENQAQICMLTKTLKYSFCSGNASIYRNSKDVALATMVFIRPKDIDYPDINKNEEYGILERMIRSNLSPITIDNPQLCCKLYVSDNKKLKPYNNGLTKDQFRLIKKIANLYKK